MNDQASPQPDRFLPPGPDEVTDTPESVYKQFEADFANAIKVGDMGAEMITPAFRNQYSTLTDVMECLSTADSGLVSLLRLDVGGVDQDRNFKITQMLSDKRTYVLPRQTAHTGRQSR